MDRAFSVAGYGTVVTGTLRRGALAVGDEVAVAPGGLAARVRGVAGAWRARRHGEPGQRVAVNLRGAEPGQVPRGTALTTPACSPHPPG